MANLQILKIVTFSTSVKATMPYRMFCPPGSLYDGAKHLCINRHEKVTCGPQPTTQAPITTTDPNAASPCDPVACQLPSCFCSNDGTKIPGDLPRAQPPSQGLEDESAANWTGEMVTMREILKNYASVNTDEVIGMRAPHLKPGRNAQFEISMITTSFGIHQWWFPHKRFQFGPTLLTTKSPTNANLAPALLDLFQWLKSDFHRHYDKNRAPYMISVSVNWFNTPANHKGLLSFIDYTLSLPDVYYTTVTQTIQWILNPQPVNTLKTFADFDCTQRTLPEKPCNHPNTCAVILSNNREGVAPLAGGTRYMKTCSRCPSSYPWVFDATGRGGSHRDTYQKVSFR
ncbi:hypothetical protein Avbf_03092 [Armadillidium vulgare]|nr:hypothetical protein Avbf_03092 [Armadillidium vulgare]